MFKPGDRVMLHPRTRGFAAPSGTLATVERVSGLMAVWVKFDPHEANRGRPQMDGEYRAADFDLHIEDPFTASVRAYIQRELNHGQV